MSHDTSHAIAANPTTARARVALNWSRLCDRLESRASASVLALIARFWGIAAVFWTLLGLHQGRRLADRVGWRP